MPPNPYQSRQNQHGEQQTTITVHTTPGNTVHEQLVATGGVVVVTVDDERGTRVRAKFEECHPRRAGVVKGATEFRLVHTESPLRPDEMVLIERRLADALDARVTVTPPPPM